MKSNKGVRGFTLLEILIALFIFTVLSMILVGALRTVINAQWRTENNAERLHQLQIALLILARDVEQAVDRPILNAAGKAEEAFTGTARDFTFTHMGLANPMGHLVRSTLQRTRYYADEDALWRMAWPVLDQAPQSQPHSRKLLTGVTDVHFKYLAKDGRFYTDWPVAGQKNQVLPSAVRIYLTIPNWGTMSQLYVISAQTIETEPNSTLQSPQS